MGALGVDLGGVKPAHLSRVGSLDSTASVNGTAYGDGIYHNRLKKSRRDKERLTRAEFRRWVLWSRSGGSEAIAMSDMSICSKSDARGDCWCLVISSPPKMEKYVEEECFCRVQPHEAPLASMDFLICLELANIP